MPMDAPMINQLAIEMNRLLPVRIDQIYQPYPDEFLVYGFGSGEQFKLFISVHGKYGRFHLWEGKKANPLTPSPFCMLLRKHFIGAKLIAMKAIPFERICQLVFEVYNPANGLNQKSIWLELTGKSSNLIITDENQSIIDAWRKSNIEKPAERLIAAEHKYELPGTGGRWKPVSISWPQFAAIFSLLPPGITIEKLILKHWYGLSAAAIREITMRAGLTPLTFCEHIKETELATFYDIFCEWAKTIETGDFQPTGLWDREGKLVDCTAFEILFPAENIAAQKLPVLSPAVAAVYGQRQQSDRYQEIKINLLRKISAQLEKASTKLSKQEEEAASAEKSDQFRIAGELLTAYGYQIAKGSTQAVLLNHYDPDGQELTIPLNPALSPQANAQNYFKKYQKARKGQRAIATQIAKTKEMLEYLESVETMINTALNEADLNLIHEEIQQSDTRQRLPQKAAKKPLKKEPPAEPHRFITPAGHTILVGRNNLQNDRLTFKIAEPTDWWFHTQKIPGSHVILRPEPGVSLDDDSLNYACQLAAYFSKARNSTKIPVDYTQRKHVKKPPAAKPGYVIYDNFKTAMITTDILLLEKIGVTIVKE